jgi:ABC-type transporter Mla subunit MlaD
MRKWSLAAMVSVALAILVFFFTPIRGMGHFGQRHYVFTSHFENVSWLRPGAKVSLAGVELGSVRSVKLRPENREQPVEVVMDVWTDKDVSIPSDATVSVQTAGVFGDSFVNINISESRGAPADSHAFLKSVVQPEANLDAVLHRMADNLGKPCDSRAKAEEERGSRPASRADRP